MKNFKNVHLGNSTIVLTNVSKTVTPQPIKVKIDNSMQDADGELIPWGSNNLYPQEFFNKKYLKNGASVGGINILKSGIFGNGMQLYKKIKNAAGKVEIQEQLYSDYPGVKSFFRENKISKFWVSKITDQALFNISFTEHVLSMNYNEIVRVKRHQAAHCRFGKMNDQGVITHIYINTDWSVKDTKYTVAVPFIDIESMTVEEIKEYCKAKKIKNFMTTSRYPLVDESYYPKADWHAVDRSGWIDVANSVPEMKKHLFENQMHFKYIVYISDYYFESFYKDEWDDFDADKRQQLREDLASAIDEHMSGNKAHGRSLVSPIFEENGKFVKGITVEPVDNKLKDGSYLPDASAANSEILFAIGVNPAIIGAGTPGGSNLGGSGSNIREAYTVHSASLSPRRVYVSDDWELWRDFNGWDTDLEIGFPSVNLTTLDKNPNGQEEIMHN